jgi:hypothetical protein
MQKARLPKQTGFSFLAIGQILPVSTTTAVAAASTTMEATTTATAIAASATTTIATRYAAAGITARAARIATSPVAVSAAIAVAATIAVAISAAPAPVVPGSDADEQAASEPARSVIAIRCASVGVIRVIAPRAIRRAVIAGSGNQCRSNSNSYRDLGIRRDSRDSGER